MAQQNIYDDEIFFEGYKKIRDNKINANNLTAMSVWNFTIYKSSRQTFFIS